MKHLKNYLVGLDEFRQGHVSLIAARTFFNQGEYAWAIKEIKNAMHLSQKIKVFSDPRINAAGFISIPQPFPKKESDHVFEIRINKDKLVNFDVFVTVMSHELSHLLLHSLDNKHKLSEKATDITSIIIGFGEYVKRGRFKKTCHGINIEINKIGYLSDAEFNFIYDCFINNRKFRMIPRKEKKPFWKSFFKK